MRVEQVSGTRCTCALPRFYGWILRHRLEREGGVRGYHARTRLWLSPPQSSPQEAHSCSQLSIGLAQVPGIACTCAWPRFCGGVLQHWLEREVSVRRCHAFGLVCPTTGSHEPAWGNSAGLAAEVDSLGREHHTKARLWFSPPCTDLAYRSAERQQISGKKRGR